MRWVRFLIIEILAGGCAALIALLENVLTNEKHPEHIVVIWIVALVAVVAIGQSVGRILSARRDAQSARQIDDIDMNTRKILNIHEGTASNEDEWQIDQAITKFPYAVRASIKLLWAGSRQEVRRVVQTVGEPASRPATVLTEWEHSAPEWLTNSNWQAVAVAGELAQAYGASVLAADLFLKAAPDSTRPQYWTSRASLLTYIDGGAQDAVRILGTHNIDSRSSEIFARIVFSLATHDQITCRMLIGQWEPGLPIDIFLSGICQLRLIVEASDGSQVAITDEKWVAVARLYRQLIERIPQSAAFRVGLANALVSLAVNGASSNPHRDLDEALDLAVSARDIARETSSNSVQAVEVACQAAYSDWRLRRVIELGTTITGEATIEEASSDGVRASVALAAILLREQDIADRLIPEIEDEFRKSTLVAMSAEINGNPSVSLWQAAFQLARNAHERSQAILGLARMGVTDSGQLEDLSRELPDDTLLIKAVAESAAGNPKASIQQLRLIQNGDINTVTSLAQAYIQSGDVPAAVDCLREGARVLNIPRLRIDAARLLRENIEAAAAVTELEQLLVDSAGNVIIRRECLGILAEWSALEGDWSTAQTRFHEVLALDPRDDKARWALILSLLNRGMALEARRVYDEALATPVITLPAQARAWMAIRLPTDRTEGSRFVNEVIDTAQRFPDDEDVQAEAIFTVLSPDGRDSPSLPPEIQGRFDRLFYHFVETWPQSGLLRTFTASDAQTLASQMDELVRPNQEQKRLREEIANQLANNFLPWGALSAITGRSYSEIVVTRAAGILPAQSHDSRETQMCRVAARAALNNGIVLDISAGGTLVEIPELSALLLSQFRQIKVCEQERLDAIKAEFHLRGRSTESWVYDEQSDRGRLAAISLKVANERHGKALVLLELVQRFAVAPVVENERMRALWALWLKQHFSTP
jgi:tetratricopeptide (TPR) repeat protein